MSSFNVRPLPIIYIVGANFSSPKNIPEYAVLELLQLTTAGSTYRRTPMKMFTNFSVFYKMLMYKYLQNQHFFKIGRQSHPWLWTGCRLRLTVILINQSTTFLYLEPIQITRSIAADCKARCLRCRPKTFSTWRKPRLRAFLACRLGLELFARPHNDPVIRISSYSEPSHNKVGSRYKPIC